jgi:hypothetical protein
MFCKFCPDSAESYFDLKGPLKDGNHFMSARLKQRIIMKFLWSEKRHAVEIHCKLYEPSRKVCPRFRVFITGSELLRQGA